MSERRLGIVGHAQEKFTPLTEAEARAIIRLEIVYYRPTLIVSGHSPMGGVDIYAEEIAEQAQIPTLIHAPAVNRWEGPGGFKERNLAIAHDSDVVLVVVIRPEMLPPGVKDWGSGFCYHCRGRVPEHVKSGGCWTAWQAPTRMWRIIGLDGVTGHDA